MSSKAANRQSVVSKDKQVDVAGRREWERKGTEEDEAEYEKEESAAPVTSQLSLRPVEKTGNLDKEVVLRRIRHRKRVNKVRALMGSFLSSPFSTDTDTGGDASLQRKRWVDDAFAAL